MLAGIAICTKQSIGVTLAVVVVGYKLLFVENKKQFITYLKIALTRICGILIPVLIFVVYLVFTRSFKDFIDYAILGISTFSNKIPYRSLMKNYGIIIGFLSILMPITIVLMCGILLNSNELKDKKKKILTLLIYGLSIIIVMYPISDEIHFLIGSYVLIISMAYLVGLILKKMYDKYDLKNKYKKYKIISFFILLTLMILVFKISFNNFYNYFKLEKNSELEHYKNIIMNDSLKDRINEVDSYILQQEKEGNKVYVIDAEAAIYMIPLDKYNKNYDMFLKGNIGKDGENGIIEDIKNRKENEIFLIINQDYRLNWQTPENVLKYVRENLQKVGEINIYEIYK